MSPKRFSILNENQFNPEIYSPDKQNIPGQVHPYSDSTTPRNMSKKLLHAYRKASRRRQRRKFHTQLALFKFTIKSIIWSQVMTWALQYAPEKCPFGMRTDFSRPAFERLRALQFANPQTKQVEELMEMVWALKMWNVTGGGEEGGGEGEAIMVEDLVLDEWTPEEFLRAWPQEEEILFDFSMISVEGCKGMPGMFAAMIMYDAGGRTGCQELTDAKAAWKQIVVACTGCTIESMAISSMAWQSRILAMVAARWIRGNKMRDWRRQWNYVNHFLMKDVKE